MAVRVSADRVHGSFVRELAPRPLDRERRLLLTARRRRLARLRRTAETAAWILGSLALALVAFGGLAGLR